MPISKLARCLIFYALALIAGSGVLPAAAPLYVPLEAEAPRRAVTVLTAGTLDSRVAAGVAFVGFCNDATRDSFAILDDVAAATSPDVFVGSINLSTERAKAAQYNIQNVPTFIVFRDGVPVSTFVGLRDKTIFVDAIAAVQTPAPAARPAPVAPAPVPAAQLPVQETRGNNIPAVAHNSEPATSQTIADGVSSRYWPSQWYIGAGGVRVGPVKWEGGGNFFDAGAGVFVIFGKEWKKDKIGFAVEDIFVFSRQSYNEQGSLLGYNGRVSMSFNEFNGFITGRAIAYLHDAINISAGAGIGFNGSWMEYDFTISNGYSSTRYWGRQPRFTIGGLLDSRITLKSSQGFAIDIGANIIFTPARDYDVQVATLRLKSGARAFFYLGARFFW